MFKTEETGIKTKFDDRPSRPLPRSINMHTEASWLASRFNPSVASQKPSLKNLLSRYITRAIPLGGTLTILGALAYVTSEVLRFYT